MSIVGSLEVPFRISNGVLADRKFLSAYNQYVISLFVAGSAAFCGAVVPGLPGILS